MKPFTPRRPGAPSTLGAPVVAMAAVASAVVIVVVLMALGIVDLSRFRSNEPSTEGLIAVPTPATAIPAYARVRRDHLWDRANSRLAMVYLPPQGGYEGDAGKHLRHPRPRARSSRKSRVTCSPRRTFCPGGRAKASSPAYLRASEPFAFLRTKLRACTG